MESPSSEDGNIAKDVRGASFSSNWKQLKKVLAEEAAEKNTVNEEGNEFEEVKRRRQRKRKLAGGTKNNANIWKKRKAEIEAFNAHPSQTESTSRSTKISKAIGLDCEYVGAGMDGSEDVLARVSMVNVDGECIYDKYVKPKHHITDYRTEVSGIRPHNLLNGESFERIQQEVHKLLAGKIVVGHALQNDFRVLNLSHTRKMTRDTSKYIPFRQMVGVKKTPSLKLLAKHILGIDIQQGEHDSISDARIAMRIYVMHKKKWETDIRRFQRKM
uniref:RNA exonuclease 4 n=1 Tax=Ascaris suum TaxID=6253 RepID=F1LB96_ASCSU